MTPLRLASIWLGGDDGRRMSGAERARIATVIPDLIAAATAQRIDPAELWRIAAQRIRDDYARAGDGRRPGVRVLCAQLARWIAPDAPTTTTRTTQAAPARESRPDYHREYVPPGISGISGPPPEVVARWVARRTGRTTAPPDAEHDAEHDGTDHHDDATHDHASAGCDA